jgi:hypothetical protein
MEKEFVPYELALKMKQLGYKKEGVDEDCFAFYDEEEYLFTVREQDDIDEEWLIAPTFSQAFRWFDYSTEWSGFIVPSKEEGCFDWWIQNYTDHQLSIESDKLHRTREEAELSCLEKLIEIVEQKNKN